MQNKFKVVVSGFVKNEEGKLLVIRRSTDEETFPNMLAIPGGTIEASESVGIQTDIVESNLIREIFEETGISTRVVSWLESTCLVTKEKANLYLFFICEQLDAAEQVRISDESPEVYWADMESVNLEECTPTLKKFIIEHIRKS